VARGCHSRNVLTHPVGLACLQKSHGDDHIDLRGSLGDGELRLTDLDRRRRSAQREPHNGTDCDITPREQLGSEGYEDRIDADRREMVLPCLTAKPANLFRRRLRLEQGVVDHPGELMASHGVSSNSGKV